MDHAHHDDDHSHGGLYLMVFIALCVLTLVSAATDFIHIPNKLVLGMIVFSVATAKALFVMMYFMHLRFEGRWKYLLLTPTILLAAAIPFALAPDIMIHYYTVDVPQTIEQPADSPINIDTPHLEPVKH